MDKLIYDYKPGTNRLRLFLEGSEQFDYDNDLQYFPTYDTPFPNPQQLPDDLYDYDPTGNLTRDYREFMNISW
jgi:hypothetical protein